MENTRGKNTRTVRDIDENSSRVSTAELVDFVKERALRLSIKDVARLTGLSEKAVVNLRSGAAGASAQTISTWCRNDLQFRAEYFSFCGGHVESDPEFIVGITKALTSLARRYHLADNSEAPRSSASQSRTAASPSLIPGGLSSPAPGALLEGAP